MSDQQRPSGSLAPRAHRFHLSWLFSLIPYLVLIGTALGSPLASAAFSSTDATFVSAPASGPFIQVSAGDHYTCGVKRGGAVACWGVSSYSGTTPTPRRDPSPRSAPAKITSAA